MRINRSNYEMYMIDYLDGKLDPSLLEEMMAFFASNPDLQNEQLGLRELPVLPETPEHFPDRSCLHLNELGLPPLQDKTFDIWLAASFEGDLNESMAAGLHEFINAKPFRAIEAQRMAKARIIQGEEQYDDKNTLKRTSVPVSINEHNILDWSLARLEGQTNALEDEAISTFLDANSSFMHEVNMMENTKLKPDLSIVYQGKDQLRRFIIPVITQRTGTRILSIAASVALLLGVFWIGLRPGSTYDYSAQPALFTWTNPQAPGIVVDPSASSYPEPVRNRIKIHGQGLDAVQVLEAGLADMQSESFYPAELSARIKEYPRVIYSDASDSAIMNSNDALTLQQLGALRLRQFAYGDSENLSRESKVNKWELADAGIAGINKLTGTKLRFDRQFNPEGKLQSFHLGGERVYLARQ